MFKRFGAWARRNSRLIILVIFYLSFLAFIFYAINAAQINDTLLGVIIALLFPIFAGFVNHLLKQDLEQRQWEREQALEEAKRLEAERTELRKAYEDAMKFLAAAPRKPTPLNHEDYKEIHAALVHMALLLPDDTKSVLSSSPVFAENLSNFNDALSLTFRRNFPFEELLDIIRKLSLSDPRLK